MGDLRSFISLSKPPSPHLPAFPASREGGDDHTGLCLEPQAEKICISPEMGREGVSNVSGAFPASLTHGDARYADALPSTWVPHGSGTHAPSRVPETGRQAAPARRGGDLGEGAPAIRSGSSPVQQGQHLPRGRLRHCTDDAVLGRGTSTRGAPNNCQPGF